MDDWIIGKPIYSATVEDLIAFSNTGDPRYTTETHIYRAVHDTWFDSRGDVACVRIEGRGDIPDGAFAAEHFANEEWTAWYRPEDAPTAPPTTQ